MSLSEDTQADIIKAFNSSSRYLNVILNIDNPYFDFYGTWILWWQCISSENV